MFVASRPYLGVTRNKPCSFRLGERDNFASEERKHALHEGSRGEYTQTLQAKCRRVN